MRSQGIEDRFPHTDPVICATVYPYHSSLCLPRHDGERLPQEVHEGTGAFIYYSAI